MVVDRPGVNPFIDLGMPRAGKTGRAWIRNYARFGIASLAVVYLLTGGLTALAALGLGGQAAGQKEIFPYLLRQPYGDVLIWILIVGMGGYIFWRFMQAWVDPSH